MTSRTGSLPSAGPSPRLTINVLAVSSLQVILLVLVGSTAFLLSVVTNLLPSPPRRVRGVSPRRDSQSHSLSTSTSINHGLDLHRPQPIRGDSGSLPELSIGSMDSTDDESDVNTLVESPIDEGTLPALNAKEADSSSDHRQVSLIVPTSTSPSRCRQARRKSLDVARHTLHIPPRSPPSSCASSLVSDDNRQSCRPKLGRIFSSGRDSSESVSVEKVKPLRRMSIKLSGFRSRGRRAISEVESSSKPDIADLILPTDTPLLSPPASPTLKAATSPRNTVLNTVSPNKPKMHSRRTASDYTVASPVSLGRHQIMAEARREMERESTMAALTRNAVDMSGNSELSMGQHFV